MYRTAVWLYPFSSGADNLSSTVLNISDVLPPSTFTTNLGTEEETVARGIKMPKAKGHQVTKPTDQNKSLGMCCLYGDTQRKWRGKWIVSKTGEEHKNCKISNYNYTSAVAVPSLWVG